MIGNLGSVFDGCMNCITFLDFQANRTHTGGWQKVMSRSQQIRDDRSAWMVSLMCSSGASHRLHSPSGAL
jgi:hypothetical protein